MNAQPRVLVLSRRGDAVCITRSRGDKTQYRIAARSPVRDGEVPAGGFLSGWCSTEARAWEAALKRQTHRVNDLEHW